MISLSTLIFLIGGFLYFVYYHIYEKRRKLPPGPTPYPFVGNIFQINPREVKTGFYPLDRGPALDTCAADKIRFLPPFSTKTWIDDVSNDQASHKTLFDWGKKYGPVFTVWFGPSPQIMINDFKLIKECLNTKGYEYGLVLNDGPNWKEQRRFSLHVLRDFGFGRNVMEEKIACEIRILCQSLRSKIGSEPGKIMSTARPLELCVGNIISSVVLGHTFEDDPERFYRLQQILDHIIKAVSHPLAQLLAEYPWLQHVPLFDRFKFGELDSLLKEYHKFLEDEVRSHQKTFDESAEPSDYVAAYMKELRHREKSGENLGLFGYWQMVMAIGDLWMAGMETSVKTLKWAILYMVHWPEVQDRCRKEIFGILSQREDKEIHAADRLSMVYTLATMQETQRLANIIPVNIPHSNTEDIQIGGHFIPRGSYILPQISAVLMNPEIFPEPEKFNPERFLTSDGKSMKKMEEFIPFSMGKRQCLGESLAKMELFMIFATLIQKFRFSPKPGCPLPTLETDIAFVFTPQPYEVSVEPV